MEEKHIVTMDLGTSKIGVSVATIDANSKVTLALYGEYAVDGIKHSKVTNPTRLSACIKDVIQKVENAMRIKVSEVMVNIQRYGIKQTECVVEASTSGGDVVSENDIEMLNNLAWEDKTRISDDDEVIACVAQSFDLDNDELNVNPDEVVGMCSSKIKGRYLVYSVKQSTMAVIDNAFHNTGVINVRKVFAPDAVGACLLSENERQGGVALIDLGAGASSVSIFHGGVLKHYGAIPFGAQNVTNDIANVCCISEKLAENIKMGFGGCMPDRLGSLGDKKLRITNELENGRMEVPVKYLSEIITAREIEIIDALLYEIQISGFAKSLKNGIVLTGGGAAMLKINELIKDRSGYNVKVVACSKDKYECNDSSFYGLGASMTSGLLKYYSSQQTKGCEIIEEAVVETKAENEVLKEGLFGTEETENSNEENQPYKNKKKRNSKIGGFFKGITDKISPSDKDDDQTILYDEKPVEVNTGKEQASKPENTENKSNGGFFTSLFGEDEGI